MVWRRAPNDPCVAATRERRSPRFQPGRLLVYATLIVWCILSIFPLLWMVGTSLKPITEPIGGLGSMIPNAPTFSNYVKVSTLLPLARNTLNSVIVATSSTLITVFLCALAGFAFAKYEFPGKTWLFFLLIGTMLIPPEAGLVPTFLIMRKLAWINTYWSLIIPRAATAIGIFYMRQYITSFPTEVMEQARLDGCGEFRIFWNLVLPVVTPALAAWATLAFIARWNDFMYPLLFMTTKAMYTLMVSISKLPVSESLSTPWPVIMAGSVIAVFPLIVIYLVLQRFQVTGLQVGAVKGDLTVLIQTGVRMNKRDLLFSVIDPKAKPAPIPAAFFLHFDPAYHLGQPAVDKHLEYFRYTGMDFVKIQFELPFPRQAEIQRPADWANCRSSSSTITSRC